MNLEECCACKTPSKVVFMCDEVSEGPWCQACFEGTPCGRGEHGEGCETMVVSE